MSRSHRDNQRRLDHKAQRLYHEALSYSPHLLTSSKYPWRWIPRYSKGRRAKGFKGRPKLPITKTRIHLYIYGHHNLELINEIYGSKILHP